jgi:hypothetical protein
MIGKGTGMNYARCVFKEVVVVVNPLEFNPYTLIKVQG